MATLINTITVTKASILADTNTYTSATVGTTNRKEEFEAEISAADGNWHIEISNEANSFPINVELVAGDYVGAKSMSIGSVMAGHTAVLRIDSSVCKLKNGKVRIGLKPSEGQSLSGGGVKLHAIQFLPVNTN